MILWLTRIVVLNLISLDVAGIIKDSLIYTARSPDANKEGCRSTLACNAEFTICTEICVWHQIIMLSACVQKRAKHIDRELGLRNQALACSAEFIIRTGLSHRRRPAQSKGRMLGAASRLSVPSCRLRRRLRVCSGDSRVSSRSWTHE